MVTAMGSCRGVRKGVVTELFGLPRLPVHGKWSQQWKVAELAGASCAWKVTQYMPKHCKADLQETLFCDLQPCTDGAHL